MKKYRVTVDGAAYSVEIENLSERPVRVRVSGELVLVDDADEVAAEASESASRPLASAASSSKPAGSSIPSGRVPPSPPAGSTSHVLVAPLPGVITSVVAKPGQVVQRGDELLTIEAMKMFNVIRSPMAGTVAGVHAVEGGRVVQGEPLVTFARPA